MHSTTIGLSDHDLVHLKSAIDQSAIVAITDARGVITYANKKFCEISRYSLSELVGKTHKIINSGYHDRDFFQNMWGTITTGQIWEGEICNRAKDGTIYWVHTTIVPFTNDAGVPVKYVSVRHDITKRKLSEIQLIESAEKLANHNQELKEFASVAAHDLQEPLRKILVFSDMVNGQNSQFNTHERDDYLRRIQNSAKRMQTLINDLLSYTRMASQNAVFEVIDLKQALSEAISNLEILIRTTEAQIEVGELPKLRADFSQMVQLFQNLIKNSLIYKKPDVPPKIYVGAEWLETSSLYQKHQFCQIRITDNGIGFDEKYLDRIFNIFQRLHGRNEYEGTGIGLAICRRIVVRHKGHITAHSRPDEGASFVVTLPSNHEGEEN